MYDTTSNLYTDQVLYINGTIIMYIIGYIMYDTMSNLYTNAFTMETMSVCNVFLKPNYFYSLVLCNIDSQLKQQERLGVFPGFWSISLHDLLRIIGDGFGF
jgi:hypothetical protein